MPWKQTDSMKERVKFVLEWEERWKEAEGGQMNMAELCRRFGISRQTGYVWVRRYRKTGSLDALKERSRRPLRSPTKVPDEIEELVVRARKQEPTWGARKLRRRLLDFYPEVEWPSASAMSAILDRNGLTKHRRRRRRTPIAVTLPFSSCDRPNAVWCIDFKGKFRTVDGTWCHVLTLVDAYSRFLLRAELMTDPTGGNVERVLDSAFQEFGLPEALRSDNGPPFASTGAGGLTKLAVWWLRLGIRLERIEPGKPQQNGRQERLHRTLEEAVSPPAANPRAQQRAIDLWRRRYNEERPHEALSMRTPSDAYTRSSTRYPRKLIDTRELVFERETASLLDPAGRLRWGKRWIHISSALGREFVEVVPANDDWTVHSVRFGPIHLGTFDERNLARGLRVPRRRRPRRGEVSTMSLD